MRALPPILLPLSEPVGVVARRGEAAQWELGQVLVPPGAAGGTCVEVHLARTSGRGRWRVGVWWADEPEPRWSEPARRLERDAVAVPIVPEGVLEQRVRVMVEVQPVGPAGQAGGVFAAWFIA